MNPSEARLDYIDRNEDELRFRHRSQTPRSNAGELMLRHYETLSDDTIRRYIRDHDRRVRYGENVMKHKLRAAIGRRILEIREQERARVWALVVGVYLRQHLRMKRYASKQHLHRGRAETG